MWFYIRLRGPAIHSPGQKCSCSGGGGSQFLMRPAGSNWTAAQIEFVITILLSQSVRITSYNHLSLLNALSSCGSYMANSDWLSVGRSGEARIPPPYIITSGPQPPQPPIARSTIWRDNWPTKFNSRADPAESWLHPSEASKQVIPRNSSLAFQIVSMISRGWFDGRGKKWWRWWWWKN